jgi:beta-glucosidase
LNASKLPDLNTLSLEQQVAQMVVVRASGYLFDHQIQYPAWEPKAAKLQHWLQNLGVGGVILLGGSAPELALRSQQLQNWSKIPLLIAADIEEGVGQRFSGATWFPPPMVLSPIGDKNPALAQEYAEQMGAITAAEALAIGINWVLAPVVDVNNNPDNPVINVRAFGETPTDVSCLATAFIKGAKKYPVLTTAKHFPGHGDTATDSHLELPVLPHTPERLGEIELPPFIAAIEAGVDAVMSAHLLIPAWDAEKPATLSEKILTQQLRKNLSFDGLIVTDALVMGAIASRYGAREAPVLAVEAAADILLMPVDPEAAIAAVCDAVKTGRISPDRIRASCERIWQAKQKVAYGEENYQEDKGTRGHPDAGNCVETLSALPCLPFSTSSSVSPLLAQLAQPKAIATAANILRESTQVFGSVPLELAKESGNLRNLIVVDNILDCEFLCRTAPALAIPEQLGYKSQLVDCHTPSMSVCGGEETFSATVLQLFIRGNPFRGSAGLTQMARDWFKKLLKTGELQALVLYGSPYVKKLFLAALPPGIPCISSYGQMQQAQAIALEILFGRAYQNSR